MAWQHVFDCWLEAKDREASLFDICPMPNEGGWGVSGQDCAIGHRSTMFGRPWSLANTNDRAGDRLRSQKLANKVESQ